MEAEAAPTVSAAASRPPLPPKGFESPTPKLDEKIRGDLILEGQSRDSTPEPALRNYFNGDVPMSPSTAPTVMPVHPVLTPCWCGSFGSSCRGGPLLLCDCCTCPTPTSCPCWERERASVRVALDTPRERSLTSSYSFCLCQDVAPSKMSFRLMRSLRSMTAANVTNAQSSPTMAMSPMFGMTKSEKSPGALASESSTPAGNAMSPMDPSPVDKGPDGKKPTCGACEMLGHLLDNTAYDNEAKQVVKNLRSDDTDVVLMTAKALSDFCDVFCVGVCFPPCPLPLNSYLYRHCACPCVHGRAHESDVNAAVPFCQCCSERMRPTLVEADRF
jgi:hypothetical protein